MRCLLTGRTTPSLIVLVLVVLVGGVVVIVVVVVFVGDYIVAEKVVDEPAAENKYLYYLYGEKLAISISISSFAEGLSGKLKSGDIVSVIAPDYLGSGETVIPAEL